MPDLDQLVKDACEAFDKLSPEEKRAHRRAQYISFTLGQLLLAGVPVDREVVEREFDKLVADGAITLAG
jgi:hypothetical protein